MKRSLMLTVMLLAAAAVSIWASQSSPMTLKAPQEVVEEYSKLGRDGSLLMSEGWNGAQVFFLHQSQPPQDIYISENQPARLLWTKHNEAEVDQEYESIGKIDSKLHYTPPPSTRYLKTSIAYKLTLGNKHWQNGPDGKQSEVTSVTAWRIENPQVRWTSIEAAIRYTERMSSSAQDPTFKQNATKTIAILKRYLPKKSK